jgi:4-amino-4-deoxy-L-arabinose transferase-like glycosyltransferase
VKLNLLSYELYHFYSFAIIFGIISLFVLKDRSGEKRLKLSYMIVIPLLIAIAIRAIPFIDNSVPLGYDPGFYKYEIERYWKGLPEIIPPDLEDWDRQWSPPGLFIITSILHLYGFNSFDNYNFLFIFFDVLVVFAIYAAGKRYFSQEAGIIAALFYSVSLVQFAAFYLFYYKNLVSVYLALIAFYMLKSKKYLPLILTGAAGSNSQTNLSYLRSCISSLICRRFNITFGQS